VTSTARPQRKDAARNRARLINAASGAFREQGLGASVNAIASAAGVDVATLYRHFRTKDDLLAAAMDALFEPLVAAGEEALTQAGPRETLKTFVYAAVRIDANNNGVFGALASQPSGSPARDRLRASAIQIAEPVVERAHQDGTLRQDFDVFDVLSMIRMLVSAAVEQQTARDVNRYMDAVLRGMRP
jgi:AcrR family transcriptional regulator